MRIDADDLLLVRLRHDHAATLGELHFHGARLCYTLEDRPPKIPGVKEPGQSRIPAGRWPLRLRAEGGFHARYTARWDWHREMVEIVLPGWKYVLFHVGNTHEDTQGCILTGSAPAVFDGALAVSRSAAAYEAVYPTLRERARAGGFLTILDEKE
ncbi:hypothetical protein E5163_14975 [Marinicauda algicola]|uniref:DUF5675 domain-containing protein n=1 Tax=Marinicauda algicola TaxID=2029849 RepID=A0A4V3RXR4_9PROT|nr:DUF5675 family protein [Marinicauda algicola]TGY87369.1 hypothetical protein E5163_14975 [Marinicauda algicola]